MTWRSQSLPYMPDTKSFNGIQRFSQDTILGFNCHHTIIEQHENVIRSCIHIDFITKMVESSGDITVRDDKCIEVYWRWLSIRRYAGRRLFVVVSYSDAYWIKKSREKTLKISLRVFFLLHLVWLALRLFMAVCCLIIFSLILVSMWIMQHAKEGITELISCN